MVGILLGVTFFIFAGMSIAILMSWMFFVEDSAVKIPFDTFAKWYSINPNSYICEWDSLLKITDRTEKNISITFGIFDYVQYMLWLICAKKQANRDEYERLLRYVQNDINKFRDDNAIDDKRFL